MNIDRAPTELAEARLQDMNDTPRRLGDFWAERPTLVLFVRHFGCIFCEAQVRDMKPHFPEIAARGYNIVIIGTGGPSFARGFAERLALDIPILSDPERVTFEAAKMRRTIGAHPMVAVKFVKALLKGNFQRRQQGDAWQQGGAMVVRPGGEVTYHHANQYAGDEAPLEKVLAATA